MRIIAGEARGRVFDAPTGMNTRPTLDRIRENIFNMIQSHIRDSVVLDLFAGSGALSFEALSRGASHAVLVDSDRKANEVQKKNTEKLGYAKRTSVLFCDWRKAIELLKTDRILFDIVFLDPPYRMTDLREVFSELTPVIHPDTLILLEHETKKEITVASGYTEIKNRSWGYCSLSIYTLTTQESDSE